MRKTFIDTLLAEARKDERIFLITADLGFSIVERFAEEFPRRFFNVGIQEQNAVSMAAGMAMSGKIVYFYTIIPFATMRCYEQIRVDGAYLDTSIRLVGVGAGFTYGPAGATHHGIEDLALMRSLPNMTVLAPGDLRETRAAVRASVGIKGPVYIRLGRGGEPEIHAEELSSWRIGKAIEMSRGRDLQLLATSNMLESALQIRGVLEQMGWNAGVTSCPSLKPFDQPYVHSLIADGKPIFTIEEHVIQGGLGSAVAELIAESGRGLTFQRFGIPDCFTHVVGSQAVIRKSLGLDVETLAQKVNACLRKNRGE